MPSLVSQVRTDPRVIAKLFLAFKAEGVEVTSRAQLIRLSLNSLAEAVDVPAELLPETTDEALSLLRQNQLYKMGESRNLVLPRKEIRLAGKSIAKGEDVPEGRAADIAELLGEDL